MITFIFRLENKTLKIEHFGKLSVKRWKILVKFLDDSIFAVQKKVMEPGEVFNQTSSYDNIITMLDSNKRAGIYYYFFLNFK